jgi:ABC-type Mn2+/Zn2+ transport system permease subunit
MIDFLKALINPDIPFLRFAVVAGMLSSAAFGIIGSYVVVKRITSIAGSIAHSVLAGIGFSLFLEGRYGIEWFPPILGALAAALISALTIVLLTTIVGIIMVIALLTLPAAVASLFSKNLWKLMLFAVIFTHGIYLLRDRLKLLLRHTERSDNYSFCRGPLYSGNYW